MTSLETRLADARLRAAQAATVAFYGANYAAVRRVAGPSGRPGEAPRASEFAPVDRARMREAFEEVMAADRRDILAGLYPAPRAYAAPPNPIRAARRSIDALRDARKVARRKQANGHSEVFEARRDEEGAYPRYYLQNFHFQTDGWLSEESARRYDMQVETLFTGAAAAMRRRAMPFVAEALAGRGRDARVLDLACGTGVLAETVKDAYPGVRLDLLDLSDAYLKEAARRLDGRGRVRTVRANAEAIPAEDGAYDLVYAVYLFHELPPKARRAVAAEIARVLKPGGRFVFVDSLQYGDETGLDALLEAFPREFHEPYYDGYCREDLASLFGEAGLKPAGGTLAFLTKVAAFEKAAPALD